MRKAIHYFLLLSIIAASFSFPAGKVEASYGPQTPIPATYDSGDVLFETIDGRLFGSSKASITPKDVDIPSGDPISKVELVDADGTVIQQLVNTSGNTYRVASPVLQLPMMRVSSW
jgi:hypothetical protein